MKPAGNENEKHCSFKTRTLIFFPIIHTRADMGAFDQSIRKMFLRKIGRAALRRKDNVINNMWRTIEETIDGLDLPYEKMRLYQDGLPVCGREVEIVKSLAEAGSRNHRLLLRMMEKGATLMGTESSDLLVEEYQLVKQALGTDAPGIISEPKYKALSDLLLRKRDRFIADRINATLDAGETGVLFLGMLHSLEDKLDKAIRLVRPLTQPLNHGTAKGR